MAAARSKGHVISAIWTKKMTILGRPWTLELQLKTLILNFGRILVELLLWEKEKGEIWAVGDVPFPMNDAVGDVLKTEKTRS